MNLNKKIAIILVNWNQYELTKACIISIKNCNYIHYSIILVDNFSHDGSGVRLKKKFPDVIFIKNNENKGFTGANNQALSYVLKQRYDYAMLLNNDTEVHPSFINSLLETFNKDESIGAVQPLILFWRKRELVWNYGGKFNKRSGRIITLNRGLNRSLIKESKYTEWISGCCFMIKTELVKKVGLLDDFFFVYYEDADWSIRIKKAGYKLGLDSNSIVFHHEGASWKNKMKNKEGIVSPFTHYLNIRNHIYLIIKHSNQFNFIGKWLYQFYKIMGYSIYFIIKLRFLKLKMVYKGAIDGINKKQIMK